MNRIHIGYARGSIVIMTMLLSSFLSADDFHGSVSVDPSFRWRLQDVNDTVRGNALANTVLIRLTANWTSDSPWSAMVQWDHVHSFNEDAYSDGVVLRNRSFIPDPAGSELNQAYLRYDSQQNWFVKLGRQAINLDNERHIGSVKFWQNEQTLDALSLHYNDNLNWNISYHYVNKAHRIMGDDAASALSPEDIRFDVLAQRPAAQLGNHQHDSHLLNINYQWRQGHNIIAYHYLIDNETFAPFSTATTGIRLEGQFKPEQLRYIYNLEWARQKDAHDNPWDYSANYFLVETGVQYLSHRFQLSYEQLGEDNGFGFSTPLASNHQFLGWADIFSGYLPGQGLTDLFATYRGRKGRLRWRLIAHQFESVENDIEVGKELDFELGWRFKRNWEAKLVVARYFADDGLADLPLSQQNLTSAFVSVSYNL